MAQLEIVTYTPYSITVKLTDLVANWPSPNTGVTEKRKVTWKYKTSSGSYTTAGTSYLENYSSETESDNYTFYNLNNNTLYYVQATISHSTWGSTTYSFETSQTTQKLSGTLIFRNYPTRTSIKFGILNPSCGYWKWYKKENGTTSWGNSITSIWSYLGFQEINYTFTNLSSFGDSTFYDFKAVLVDNNGNTLKTVEFDRINCAPSAGFYVKDFSYNTWNAMVDSVYNLRGAWSSSYASSTNTKMTSQNRTLTTTRMKSLWYNIKLGGGTMKTISTLSTDSNGVPLFTTSTEVKADWFYDHIPEGIDSMPDNS